MRSAISDENEVGRGKEEDVPDPEAGHVTDGEGQDRVIVTDPEGTGHGTDIDDDHVTEVTHVSDIGTDHGIDTEIARAIEIVGRLEKNFHWNLSRALF